LFKGQKVDLAVESALSSAQQRTQFVEDNLRRIFLQIYRMVGNVADAQDLAQEAFIKALQRQEQLQDQQKAAHWLSRIATNTALDFLRRHGRVSFIEIEEAPEVHRSYRGSHPADSPEELLLQSEHHDYLQDALGSLTPRERAAFVLRDLEDIPAEEVAHRLGCSQATVRSHIANARIKLKKYMARRKR